METDGQCAASTRSCAPRRSAAKPGRCHRREMWREAQSWRNRVPWRNDSPNRRSRIRQTVDRDRHFCGAPLCKPGEPRGRSCSAQALSRPCPGLVQALSGRPKASAAPVARYLPPSTPWSGQALRSSISLFGPAFRNAPDIAQRPFANTANKSPAYQ